MVVHNDQLRFSKKGYQYAVFVEQTDNSKLAIQQSLDKLETLKKHLCKNILGEVLVMGKDRGYSYIVFYAFAMSFALLCLANAFFPISNFKMTVLSAVAYLLSLQQLMEAKEALHNKTVELEMKSKHQSKVLDLIDSSAEISYSSELDISETTAKSQWLFMLAIIVLIVGLTLDFNYQNTIIANTLTIGSFSAIFLTMGNKERFAIRIEILDKQIYEVDQRIINNLKIQIDRLQKM